MKRILKGQIVLIISIFLPLILFSSVNHAQASVLIINDLDVGDWFIWDVEYSNSYSPNRDINGSCEIQIEDILEPFFFYQYNDSESNFYNGILNPNMTLRNLPLGTVSTITTIPTLNEIVPNICFISVNWSENIQLFINGTYSPYYDYSIENPGTSKVILNRLYFYKGAYRKVYVFEHSFAADFTLVNEETKGNFSAVYDYNKGFLIDFEMHVEGVSTHKTLDLHLRLASSNQKLKWSIWSKLLTVSSTIISPYMIGGLIGGIYAAKDRREQRVQSIERKKKEEEKKQVLDKEIRKIQKDLSEEYYFIEKCPFCLAELKKGQKKCPHCKGKK